LLSVKGLLRVSAKALALTIRHGLPVKVRAFAPAVNPEAVLEKVRLLSEKPAARF